MARLPEPRSDKGRWGDLLNEYLRVAHNDDGTPKSTPSFDSSAFVAGVGPYTSSVPARPTEDSAFVIWNGTTDPGSNAQDGDIWIAP